MAPPRTRHALPPNTSSLPTHKDSARTVWLACPPGVDPATAPFNHSALAVFDDMVLADGAALLTELAVRRLTR